jgi:hypothetical protein
MGQTLEGLMKFLRPLFFFLAFLTILFLLHSILIMINEDGSYAPLLSLLDVFEIILIPIFIIVFIIYVLAMWVELGDDIMRVAANWNIVK